jgi:peptidoglycan/LPS O-acetylase OafA/YrhL
MSAEIFFTITGFLITKAIHCNDATGWLGFVHFWSNRYLRLFPSYWVAPIIGLMVVPVALHLNIKMSRPRGAGWLSAILIAGQAGLLSRASGLGADPLLANWRLSVELFYYALLSIWAARSLPNAAVF